MFRPPGQRKATPPPMPCSRSSLDNPSEREARPRRPIRAVRPCRYRASRSSGVVKVGGDESDILKSAPEFLDRPAEQGPLLRRECLTRFSVHESSDHQFQSDAVPAYAMRSPLRDKENVNRGFPCAATHSVIGDFPVVETRAVQARRRFSDACGPCEPPTRT